MVEPGPGAALRFVHAQRREPGRFRPGQGPVPARQPPRPSLARQRQSAGAGQHRLPLRSRQRLLPRLARREHDLFECGLQTPGIRNPGSRPGPQGPPPARPAGPEAGPAPARDRLRLGGARGDCGARLRRGGRRPHSLGGTESLGRGAGAGGGAKRPDRDPSPGLSRRRGPFRRRRQRRDGRGGGAALLAGLSGRHRAGAGARRQGGAPAHLDPLQPVRRLCRERGLHPDLCLPGRNADRGGAV